MAIMEFSIEEKKYITLKEAAEFYNLTTKEYFAGAIREFICDFYEQRLYEITGTELGPAAQRIEETLFGSVYEVRLESERLGIEIPSFESRTVQPPTLENDTQAIAESPSSQAWVSSNGYANCVAYRLKAARFCPACGVRA